MTRFKLASLVVLLIVLCFVAPRTSFAAGEALCYAAADDGNQLVSSWRTGGGYIDVGDFGASSVEAIAFNIGNSILYGADGDELGTIDLTDGDFTAVAGSFGTADGALGPRTIDDVDGLAFDPGTGVLYGSNREGGDDLLVQIDPATGLVVPDAFGPDLDYVVILASPVTGFDDIDDLAVDPTDGQMYAISNDGGTDDRLVRVDKYIGSVIDVGPFIGADDMEGLSVSPDGELFGTTGNTESLWNIDKTTGQATFVFTYPTNGDYEGVACMRSNVITGTVFADLVNTGSYDPTGGDVGLAGVTVRLYEDDGDGVVGPGDTLIQTTVTQASGFYEFFLTAEGGFVMDIDPATLPAGWTMTTDNTEASLFSGYGGVDAGNDFGAHNTNTDLLVTKTAAASACPGDPVTYTVTIENTGSTTQSGITLTDPMPAGLSYVAQSTVVSGFGNTSSENFRDDFEVRAYDNQDGSLNWEDDWVETNDDDDPADGDIQIVTGGNPTRLRITDNDVGIFRAANLSGVSVATLTLDYRRRSFDNANDSVGLYVTSDDWATFTELDRFAGPANDGGYTTVSYDVSAYTTAQMQVGFLSSPDLGGNDRFLVEYVEITVPGATGATTKDNIPGGANPDLVDGDPPNLVAASDGFQLDPGQMMTAVFQAVVNDPFDGVPPLVNSASAESNESTMQMASAVTVVNTVRLGDTVYYEFNDNGVQDPNELGIAGAPVYLWTPGNDGVLGTADDVLRDRDITDQNGIYAFADLGSGTYRVEVDEDWLATNGYTEQRVPALPAGPYYDFLSLGCPTTELGADFGYWDANPVPVTLSSFRSYPGGSGTVVEWSTATELGTVGFNLYAYTNAGWRRVNPELIPSRAVDSVKPLFYSYEVSDGDAERFLIEDVDILGHPRIRGPFAAGAAFGLDHEAYPEKKIDWSSIRAEHLVRTAERFAESSRAEKTKRLGGVSGGLPGGDIVDVLVSSEGIYRLSYEELLAYGIDLAHIQADEITLKSNGESVPIHFRGGQVFGPGSSIEWIGHGLDTLYTKENVYTLALSGETADVRIDGRTAGSTTGFPDHYMETTTVERNRRYSFASPIGDPWYDTSILAYTSPANATFEIVIDDLAAVEEKVVLNVEVWGVTNWPASPDHHLEVRFNGTLMSDTYFDGLRRHPLEVRLPTGVLTEGVNTLELTLPGDTGVNWDMVNFESFSVTFPRRFTARDGRLSFTAKAEVLRVDGLPSTNVVVYRIVGDAVTRVTGIEMVPAANGYAAIFRGTSEPARYLVSTVEALGIPDLAPIHDGLSILSRKAEYLIISHPDFIGGLDPLVTARKSDGYRVRVVNVEDIYAEFSHGVLDPEAIRSYIAYAADQLGTEMVLLVGGDSYDYHDYLGLGAVSFIPSLYAQTGEIVSFAPVDPLFTDIDDDGVPDLPIGRLPVRTTGELDLVISKTLDYADLPYPRTAVFAADLAETNGTSFSEISNKMIARLRSDWQVTTAYLDELSVTDAHQRLVDAINGGTALTSYFGHSGPSVWSFENLFHASEVENLTNHQMPTVVTQWGCWNAYYVAPEQDTLSHRLLLEGDQGAAAVLGASTLTMTDSDQELGALFIPRLVRPGATVGEALQNAKQRLASEHPEMVDVLLGWTLLGDPALVVTPR